MRTDIQNKGGRKQPQKSSRNWDFRWKLARHGLRRCRDPARPRRDRPRLGSQLLTRPLELEQRLDVLARPELLLPGNGQPLERSSGSASVPVDLLQKELGTGDAEQRDGPVAPRDDVLEPLSLGQDGWICNRLEGKLGQADERVLERRRRIGVSHAVMFWDDGDVPERHCQRQRWPRVPERKMTGG